MSESFEEAMQRLITLPPISEAEVQKLSQAILEMATGDCTTKEVEPGVWQHTFTPHPLDELIRSEPTTATGTLTAADIDALLEQMSANFRAQPDMLFVSPGMMYSIRHAQRIGQLYHAHPVPRRKIRKCHMRKLQATWCKGKAHIRRVEQAERAREEAEMRRR